MKTETTMIAAIHQPNFLPWLGYFYKMHKSSTFVFLEDVQYIRRGYTSRVKIKTPEGETWLSVPVLKKGRYHQTVAEVELDPDTKGKKKILGTLQSAYAKAPHFKTYFPPLEAIIHKEHSLLTDLNIELIKWLAQCLDIRTPTLKASELPEVTGQATDHLVTICRALNASHYLSGFGGQKYQEAEIFQQNGIELVVYDFQQPVYPQLWGEFCPGLSAIDLLFNCGPAGAEILKGPHCTGPANGESHEL